MCGIFGYYGTNVSNAKLIDCLLKNQHRGPDNTKYLSINNLFLGFNRLQINGIDDISNQPFNLKKCYLICNGELL